MINLIEYALTRRKLTSDVSDYLDEHLTNPTNPPIDNSLAIEGAAADAKATGNAISALNTDLFYSFTDTTIWESGGISSSNGNNSASSTRIRTADYLSKAINKVVPASGYKFVLFAYTEDDDYVGAYDGSIFKQSATWFTESLNIKSLSSTYQYRLVFATTSDASITASDATNCAFEANTDPTLTREGISADAKVTGEKITTLEDIVYKNVPYEYSLTWTDGKYIVSSTGNLGTASTMACTEDYYPIYAGQTLYLYLKADGDNECAVAYYDTDKTFTGYATANGGTAVTVSADGYARFSTKTSVISTSDAYVKNLGHEADDESDVPVEKNYFISNTFDSSAEETALTFNPTTPKLDYSYKGSVTPQKRFMAIGFDDFRASDFSAIIPLFEKYGGKATFNRYITSSEGSKNKLSDSAINYINQVIFGAHEMGDHTILHYAFPFEDALFNGQDPTALDGSQTEYPTNDHMRTAGPNMTLSNYFWKPLANTVRSAGVNGVDNTILDTAWQDLTDDQCQTIRETFSCMKNPVLAPILDELSNYYLGTTGTSDGSYDSNTGLYTGGIFTGCATSENHEIWERILTIVQMFYKEKYGLNWNMQCWSWPGQCYFGCGYWRASGALGWYYEPGFTQYYNMNARFGSSLYTDELGNAKERSFTDVLREFGYKYTHDYIYPGRMDYQSVPAMRRQFYLNEHLSKPDAVLYPTDRTVSYSTVNSSYPSSFFTSGKTKAAQMYDGGGVFYTFIEALRHDTANGIVHGEVIDSFDTYSMRTFLEEALRFCKSAGIEVITKAEAYDVCFNHPIENGNLIYNPMLINSAEEFFTDATDVPTNPDGYTGDCSVTTDADGNILVTSGDTTYLHYGVPLGKLIYSADVKGTGTITFKLIKCGTKIDLSDATALTTVTVDSSGAFTSQTETFVIPNNPLAQWTQSKEGLDNKVMGLMIVYSTGLQIKNIRLEKA